MDKRKKYNLTPDLSFDETAEQLADLFKEETKDPNFAPGKMFGHYRIEKELGRGGMGIVCKAYDTRLNTYVALKVVLQEEETELIARFLREASATAQLNHPNIVRFYEAGESPRPYFTMEYIEGWTLAKLIKEKKVKPLYLIDIMIKLCDALYLAHKNKILHRDIKPSNIMITKQGEPKIMDFGLAKLTKENTEQLSRSGQPLGTLLYMPPEQVEGKATKKSDIYSIGATIYEAITYRAVFQGENEMNLMYQILNDLPIPPRELNPDISPYLEAICLKCINKKSNKRYSDFKQLARELKNLKAHRPIIAKKYSQLDVLQNFVRKNKVICTSILFFFIVVFVAFSITIAALNQTREQKRLADRALEESNKQRNFAKTEQKKAQDVLNATMKVINHVFINELLREDKELAVLSEKLLTKLEQYGEQEDWTDIKGYITLRSGSTKKSIEYYSKLIEKKPNLANAYTNRGALYKKQKKYLEAEQDYNKAISLNPNFANTYNNRGNLYREQKRYVEAEKDYTKAIFLNPYLVDAYTGKGTLYANQKRYIEAERNYNKAIFINPNYARAYCDRGHLYEELKKYVEAEKDYSKAISIDPNFARAYNNRGNLYTHHRRHKKAEEDYNKAISIDPNYVLAYCNRGNLYINLGRYKKAEKDYNKAISIDPGDAKAYINKGILYYHQKKYKKAIQNWEKVISLGGSQQEWLPWINKAKKQLGK